MRSPGTTGESETYIFHSDQMMSLTSNDKGELLSVCLFSLLIYPLYVRMKTPFRCTWIDFSSSVPGSQTSNLRFKPVSIHSPFAVKVGEYSLFCGTPLATELLSWIVSLENVKLLCLHTVIKILSV